jgi:hypothetical protein
VPTITNLMAAGCGADMKPASLTDVDLTYLHGLYAMTPGGSYLGERASITFEMKKDLGGYWKSGPTTQTVCQEFFRQTFQQSFWPRHNSATGSGTNRIRCVAWS